MPKPQATGFMVTGDNRLAVGLGDRTLFFGLRPDEMRGLAAALMRAADEVDAEAADAASAVLGRAAGRLQ